MGHGPGLRVFNPSNPLKSSIGTGIATGRGRRGSSCLQPAEARAIRSLRGDSASLRHFSRLGVRQRSHASRVRSARDREVPRLRRSRARVRPVSLRRLRLRSAGRLLLQGPRLVSELYRPPHGGDRRTPHGQRPARRADANVDAHVAVSPAVSAGVRRRVARRRDSGLLEVAPWLVAPARPTGAGSFARLLPDLSNDREPFRVRP